MEPVSLVVMALLAGASAAGKAAVGEGVKDAYAKLKGLVAARFAHREEAQTALSVAERQALEKGPEQVDMSWRTVLDGEVEHTGASHDQEVLAAAQQLMGLLDVAGMHAGKYSVDNRSSQGAVTGDANTVTQHFDSRPATPPT